ncbi:hypothetical protein TELCIR_04078 [Teladorsagia circumcincta]|uniref:Uncharacterized protein n=1 Tax=Teladorsagia circumcincta TaxID=45464 RepID=A0A2G9UUM4_TELCI|nr:hypothetical protein TELCIR_04078 [Teladorsagia circumcincta]
MPYTYSWTAEKVGGTITEPTVSSRNSSTINGRFNRGHILFCCRQRVTSVLNRRGFFTGSREGFERIPLYKSDEEDEEDLFDLQKL